MEIYLKTFNEYQEFTKSLAVYNTRIAASVPVDLTHMNLHNTHKQEQMPYLYPVLALAEEAGEVAGKVAKYVRKRDTNYELLRADVGKELGDVAYQLSETARQFGYTLQEIIDMNVEKLTDRKDRGVLVGEGDNR